MGMDQYLLIPFLVGWTSIYQLFWCSLGTRVLTHPQIYSNLVKPNWTFDFLPSFTCLWHLEKHLGHWTLELDPVRLRPGPRDPTVWVVPRLLKLRWWKLDVRPSQTHLNQTACDRDPKLWPLKLKSRSFRSLPFPLPLKPLVFRTPMEKVMKNGIILSQGSFRLLKNTHPKKTTA